MVQLPIDLKTIQWLDLRVHGCFGVRQLLRSRVGIATFLGAFHAEISGAAHQQAGARSSIIRKPLAKRSWLLGCTAIVAGVLAGGLAMAPGAAMAGPGGNGCGDGDFYECYGSGDNPVSIAPEGDFQVEIGGTTPFVSTTSGDAFTIDAAGNNTTEDGIHLHSNSSITTEDGYGMVITNPGVVDFVIDQPGSEDSAASIVGTEGGILIVGEDGTVHITNGGHVEGKNIDETGVGLEVAGTTGGQLAFELDNHSYGSLIGDIGIDIHDGIQSTDIDNSHGLIAGVGHDGISISNVFRDSEDGAVQIVNGDVGIIAGRDNGIDIAGPVVNEDLDGGAIYIDNGIYYDSATHHTDGGLIYGDNYAGINIQADGEGIVGDVLIANGGTRGAFRDASALEAMGLDSAVFSTNSEDYEPLLNSLMYDPQSGIGVMPLGIIGEEVGVAIGDVTGNVMIDNSGASQKYVRGSDEEIPVNDTSVGGVILGEGVGVGIHDIDGYVDIDNGNNGHFVAGNVGGTGGLIAGLTEDGIRIYSATEVNIDNSGGTVWGAANGILINGTDAANIYNAAGRIVGYGYGEDGVAIAVAGADRAVVYNYDLEGDGDVATRGGQILGYSQAIYLAASDYNVVANGTGGAILGSGYEYLDGEIRPSDPVIELHAGSEDTDNVVANFGLISSYLNLPHLSEIEPYGLSVVDGAIQEDPGYSIDVAAIESDVDTFGDFAWTGGQSGSLHRKGTSLSDYGDAARQLVIQSSGVDSDDTGPLFGFWPGGKANVTNYAGGTLIGRIEMFGAGSEDGANVINNLGTWYVSDVNPDPDWVVASILTSEDYAPASFIYNEDGASAIGNGGLIQTAFSADTRERGSFYGGGIANGGYFDTTGSEDWTLVPSSTSGLISAVDGGIGDAIVVSGALDDEAEFVGVADGHHLRSFVGLDVDLGPGDAEFALADDQVIDGGSWGAPEDWRSDRFYVDGELEGSTGLIFNKINHGTTHTIGDTIVVAHAEFVDGPSEDGCADYACKAGDSLYIASQSAGYTKVDGVGVMQDGLYGWYLHAAPSDGDGADYVLVSDWAPADVHLPGVVTGAQNAFYDTGSQVEDHIYGQHFPDAGEGGSGADLAVGEAPVGPATGGTPAVWAKVTGDHFTRNTTVAQSLGGIATDYDTAMVQNTFSLLGGADYQSNAGDGGVRVGVFGAYINSALGFSSFGASASMTGGSLGGYVAYTNGGFYVDSEAKVDVLSMTYSSGGLSSSALATTVGVLGNAGYRMQLGSSFVEPTISAAYANTTIQDMTMGSGKVDFGNGESIRAGIGAKVGTEVALSDEISAEFALTGKVWNEFGKANTVTVSDGVNSESFADGISGLFGEVAVSATVYNTDRTLSGFASVGDKFNSSFNSVNGKAGIRKSF